MSDETFILRGGIALQDEYSGVIIDSVGNFVVKTKGDPRELAAFLKMLAQRLEWETQLEASNE